MLALLAQADPNSIGALTGLALKAIFVENILLAFFLGMCSYLASPSVSTLQLASASR